MNFSIEKLFVIPEIWIKIFNCCSYQEVFNIIKFLYLYQKKSKQTYNINLLVKVYVLNNINSNKLDRTIYKVFKKIRYLPNKPTINYCMKYYTNIYTYSQQENFEKSAHSYILKKKIDTILNNDGQIYTKKTSKYTVFNMILSYLNKQYKILCNNTPQYQSTDKISELCYKNNCNNKNRCNSCIEIVYWDKLLDIIDTPLML